MNSISVFLVYFGVPVVIFASIARFSEVFSDLRILVLSFSIFFFSSIAAFILFKFLNDRIIDARPFILSSINPNGFYLPFPIIYALFGGEGLIYSTIYLLVANVVNAFYIYPLYSYYSSSGKSNIVTFSKGILLFPPFLASILGFVFLSSGITFPEQIILPISYLGQFTTYVALLFVGLNIDLRGESWFSRSTLAVAGVRLFIVPLILFGLMKYLGLIGTWSFVILIHSGMPPAVNNIILADHFRLDKKLMAKIVTEVTTLSLLTLPLLLYLGNSL
jgi:predicted permease